MVMAKATGETPRTQDQRPQRIRSNPAGLGLAFGPRSTDPTIDADTLTRRREAALRTGYLLPPATAIDAADEARVERLLDRLPDDLKALPSLFFVEVADASIDIEPLRTEDNGQALAPTQLIVALTQLLEALARLAPDVAGPTQLVVPAPLLQYSNSPAYEGLLAFAIVAQIARHQLLADEALADRWASLWTAYGRSEALGRVGGDATNGYAISVAVYAVAPQILIDRAPATFALLFDQFGDTLDGFAGCSTDRAALELVIALADLAADLGV